MTKVSPERTLAVLIEFYKCCTFEIFAEYFFGIPKEKIQKETDDYHRGKFLRFQKNMGEFLCYLDYEHRRMLIKGAFKYIEEYEAKHDFKVYPEK